MNGAGNWLPGPGGAGGPGGNPGANVDRGGTGVPGTSGGGSPGRPAILMPGVGGRPAGFGGDVNTSTGAGKPGPPNGPDTAPAQGSGLSGRGSPSAAGVYEHGDPGGTAGPG